MLDFNFKKQKDNNQFVPYKIRMNIATEAQDNLLKDILDATLVGADSIGARSSSQSGEFKELITGMRVVLNASV